jgi:hypothetical protein
MEKASVALGWHWFKQGVVLFRKQPTELAMLFIAYLFLTLGIGIIPLLGQPLSMILAQPFSIAFIEACVRIEGNRKVTPNLLLAGFRSPYFGRLLQLGVLYLLAAALAIFASSLVDGGIFWKAMTGQIKLDPQSVQQSDLPEAMLFATVVYLPAAMAFWYAAPLVAWQGMRVPKAVFYSFFAVWRHVRAFAVYGLALALFGVLLPVTLATVVALFAGQGIATLTVLMPMFVIMTVVMYCSFYVTYTHVFGAPKQAEMQEKSEADR